MGTPVRRAAEGKMKNTFTTKIAGAFVLLSMAAEFAALGVALSHGSGPATMNAMNWGVGDQLLTFQPDWMRVLFSLGVLAPCLSMLAWPGMYHILAPGGPAAFFGVIVSALGMLFGVAAEAIRLSMVMTLPSAYLAAADGAKPSILTLGAFLGHLFQILAQTSLIIVYGAGMPLIAAAIVRGRGLPRWLGWVLLVPSVLVGYVGAPLLILGNATGGPFVGLGLNVFFIWYVVIGVQLLRWSPVPGKGQAAAS